MQKFQTSSLILKDLPDNPGVYMYADNSGEIIYVGKAKNLKNRISSYFATNLLEKTSVMMSKADTISFIKVNSEIEALLLEAKLIKKYLPKYNIELRDDKSPLYIGITNEKYPCVLSFRKTQLDHEDLKYIFGPFTQGFATRKILRSLRRVFPYSQHKPGKRVCLYNQIGLCDPCPSEIEMETDPVRKEILRKEFKNNLRNIRKFLRGEFNSLKRSLQKDMKEKAATQNFEAAAEIKSQIQSIDFLTTQPVAPVEYIKDPNLIEDIRGKELKELQDIINPYIKIKNVSRIECFDIAHLAGTNPTASMVTFINGEPEKAYYRHFKVKRKRGDSDVDSMKEILRRRLTHLEDWGVPDLIIVDGGKPQVSAALEVVTDIPLVGLAKQFETIVIKTPEGFKEIRLSNGSAKNLVQRMRDEAHRFARRLHHKHVSKQLIS